MIPYRARAVAKRAITGTIGRLTSSPHAGVRFASLCYHSVSTNQSYLSVQPGNLKEHVKALLDCGFRFATMSEVAAAISSNSPLSGPTVALAFDDGYKDGLTVAQPILAAAGVRGTFYVTTGLASADPGTVQAFRALTHYDAEYLGAGDLRELHAAGMEIGTHTHTHPNLARSSPAAVRHEIQFSKDWIQQALGAPVDQFAYPFGKRGLHYTDATVALVKACGIRGAASVECVSAASLAGLDPFQIPRFFVTWEDTVETVKEKVFGALNWLGWFQANSPAWLKAALSPEDSRV